MSDLKSLAIAKWRLEKWLDKAEVEKKLPAESSIRVIGEFLENQGIKIIDPSRQEYDTGLAVDVVCVEDPESKSRKPSVITEVMAPIVLKNDEVISRGQVVISKPYTVIKKQAPKATTKKLTKSKKNSARNRKESALKNKVEDKNG